MIGEKLPCYRTDLLRRFPFPERDGDNSYVPEAVVWFRIGEEYRIRCIDRVVRIYHRDLGDANAVMNRFKNPASNAWGRMQHTLVVLDLAHRYWPRFAGRFAKVAAGYVRCALHAGVPLRRQPAELHGPLARALWAAAVPVGVAAWAIDRRRARQASARSASK
jgi:hypothetical protein